MTIDQGMNTTKKYYNENKEERKIKLKLNKKKE